MEFDGVYVSWFDLLVVAVVILGFMRGRRRGMSEELLDVIKWMVIVLAGTFLYQPIGVALAAGSVFSLLSCYLAAYLGIIVLAQVVFSFIRRKVGEKLVASDVFGPAEYYAGMVAGAVRYTCILVVVMAFLNARYFSPQEVWAGHKKQQDNFGSVLFPTFSTFQDEVFKRSWIGRMTRNYLPIILIEPTSPEQKDLADAPVVRAREKRIYQVLDK